MQTNSLSFRLLLSAGLVLTAFFALVALVLEQAFQQSTEQALREKLQIQIYSLLSVAEMDRALQLKMPDALREPRFSNPGSGLYAAIRLSDQSLVWRSPSAVGVELPVAEQLQQGEFAFVRDNSQRFVLHYAVLWENEAGFERAYVFTVAEDGQLLDKQVAGFRVTLTSWLSGIGVLLVLTQFLLLRWGLKPLRQIEADLGQIEAGAKSRLDGRYPAELKAVAGNLNALISSERAHLERYRNTLADLAHSLKTPLAILRGSVETTEVNRETIQHQISRMNEIVDYQLQKAAAKGRKKLTGKVDINAVLDKIIASLSKVYQEKRIDYRFSAAKIFRLYCEEGDIYEIAGNLLDNASKWCRSKVRVSLTEVDANEAGVEAVLLTVEDDGPGIAPEKIAEIMHRGVRADENTEGHGIGMAVVHELVELLGGDWLAAKAPHWAA
nr:ATP-binding protein [Methylomarinum sp. Ch1-1]MDP4521102.1 ATP-binding protein [Methylomarinum sp. Ch1-1]